MESQNEVRLLSLFNEVVMGGSRSYSTFIKFLAHSFHLHGKKEYDIEN